jgi:hypothetical protein
MTFRRYASVKMSGQTAVVSARLMKMPAITCKGLRLALREATRRGSSAEGETTVETRCEGERCRLQMKETKIERLTILT